jgi:hypothetical protein
MRKQMSDSESVADQAHREVHQELNQKLCQIVSNYLHAGLGNVCVLGELQTIIVNGFNHMKISREAYLTFCAEIYDEDDGTKEEFRVWHIPNPPGQVFHAEVSSVVEAKKLLNYLADYDNFLGDNHILANVQGLEIRDDTGEWVEWHDDLDRDISQVLIDERSEKQPGEKIDG